MESYKQLGNKYLKQNRKRLVITILGCLIVAACLYAFLNFMCNMILDCRNIERETDDFEILILSDNKEKIEAIVNEDFVRSAYIGKAYSWTEIDNNKDETEIVDDEYSTPEDGIYANALHINVDHIFLVKHYKKYIQETYQVEAQLNSDLLWTYGIDDSDDNVGFVIVLLALAISYIFAIIGVGIIRNNVQLSAMERIKDYGNLRCIGATKKQVRAIVFRESFVMETVGIVGGILVGYLISIPFCIRFKYPVGFHILPIFFLMIAFYGDMYFAIGDATKKVLKVSPVEAIKGNYRIRNRKIKRRRSGIWSLLFGVEGDYAYKNIKRNNGRFLKTLWAMAFGLGTVVVIGSLLKMCIKYVEYQNKEYGYYQQYLEADTNTVLSNDELKAQLYSPKAIRTISEARGVTSPKFIYGDTVYTAERNWVYNNLNDAYKNESTGSYQYVFGEEEMEERFGKRYTEICEEFDDMMKDYRSSGNGLVDYEGIFQRRLEEIDNPDPKFNISFVNSSKLTGSNLKVYGYDAEDYERYSDNLIEGTAELSENGVILVNQDNFYDRYEVEALNDVDSLYSAPDMKAYTFMDLHVGDEITIVDPVELRKVISEEMKRGRIFDEEILEKKDAWDRGHKGEVDENGETLQNPYEYYMDVDDDTSVQRWIIESARQQLVEEGKVKTYVIEGIVKEDPNTDIYEPTIILPLDNYYDITGNTESDYSGFHFHIKNIFSSSLTDDSFQNAINEKDILTEEGYTYSEAEKSIYLEELDYITWTFKSFLSIGAIILVIVLISSFNTMNASISNLRLRRNEFAQLRALGMTKKSLLKAILLEGGIVWILSAIIGIIGGTIVAYSLYRMFAGYVIATRFTMFWIPIIVAMILSLLVLCGTNYICFKDMKLDIATELTQSGE